MKYEPTLDAMATFRNRMCEKFYSLLPQYKFSGINFFAQQLNSGEVYWVCPPPKLVVHAFQHLLAQQSNITAYLGFPEWKHSNFWTTLLQGEYYHGCIQKVFYAHPKYNPNNDSDTMFHGKKHFRFIIVLIRSKERRDPRVRWIK